MKLRSGKLPRKKLLILTAAVFFTPYLILGAIFIV